MRGCAGLKRDGGRCAVAVDGAQQYCHLHDPARAEQRKRDASRAAKSKTGTREIRDLKAELRALKDGVLAGTVERNRAAVAAQVFRIIFQAVELERRVRETDELAERITALESSSSRKSGSTANTRASTRWTGRIG